MHKQYRLAVLSSSDEDDPRSGRSYLGHWKLDTLEPLARRYGEDGRVLPILGLVIDALPLEIAELRERSISVGKDVLHVADGVVGGLTHLVVVTRPTGRTSKRRLYAHAKLLHELGVRQIFAVATAKFDHDVFVRSVGGSAAAEFIDLTGAPTVAFAPLDGSCGRLTPELAIAMRARGFEELPEHMATCTSPVLENEKLATEAFKMCFSGFRVVGEAGDVEEGLSKYIATIAMHGLRRVPPTTSCLCGR